MKSIGIVNGMMPLISIIMPLYNAERFLREALVSVSNQTFHNYEMICIDDGSDDDTVNIVREFQKEDPRIKLLHNKKHSGAAVARNLGLKEARGKYLIFLDGDDIFDEEMLSLAYEKAEETNTEIVMFEAMHARSEDIYKKHFIKHSTEYKAKFCKEPISINNIKVCDFLLWSSAPWNKLFLREFINNNRLEFQNLSCDNDTYFVDMAFFLADRIIILDSDKIMLYARDHFTPSRISTERDPMCIYYAMLKIKEELQKRDLFRTVYRIFNYRAFYYMITGLKGAKNYETREEFFNFLVNKGFKDLLETYGTEFGVDQFLEDKKNRFIDLRLGEGWEQIDSVYEVFLEENLEEIGRIFKECKMSNMGVGIWGVGLQGRKFIDFCNRHNLKIDRVFDKDETKYGNYYGGYLIQLPGNVSGLQVIISTPGGGVYSSIKEMVKNYDRDVKVIDLNSLICFY